MTILDSVATLRPLTPAESQAVALWVPWVHADIDRRAALADTSLVALDPAQVERFTIEAVMYRLAHPDDATQVEVQVDDARVSRRYSSSTGQLTYLPEWWAWLGLGGVVGGAFTIAPSYEAG